MNLLFLRGSPNAEERLERLLCLPHLHNPYYSRFFSGVNKNRDPPGGTISLKSRFRNRTPFPIWSLRAPERSVTIPP